MSWAVRITLDEADLSNVIQSWKGYCDQIIAYQHLAPPASRVHAHLLLINCTVSPQRLKQKSGREERGNTFWNFKSIQSPLEGTPTTWNDCNKYITYMSKGIYQPSFIWSNKEWYSWSEMEALKNKWVAPAVPAPRLTTLQRYMEFEKLVRLMPFEQRNDETWLRLHARQYLFPQYQMINQQYKNDLSNFVETYKFKYKL